MWPTPISAASPGPLSAHFRVLPLRTEPPFTPDCCLTGTQSYAYSVWILVLIRECELNFKKSKFGGKWLIFYQEPAGARERRQEEEQRWEIIFSNLITLECPFHKPSALHTDEINAALLKISPFVQKIIQFFSILNVLAAY